MPTVFSHAVFAVSMGSAFTTLPARVADIPARFWILTALCAALPDMDVIGFAFGIRYGDVLGHRGLSHSMLVALLLSWVVVAVCFKGQMPGIRRATLIFYFFVVTISHACLDALTNGGLGVAFFAPFDNTRYFFPWTPIQVSPIGASFFTARGVAVLVNELGWVWIPSLAIIMICQVWGRLTIKPETG
ncbi:MAG TPA: metal-dependent hydrolase [Blastocatellia bacterium]|nr:metal-dependent hydrolase [Blastocatellia bacterium]